MSDDPLPTFARALRGRTCTVEKVDYEWVFDFGDKTVITVAFPWQIMGGRSIVFTVSDDGHQFGRIEPIVGMTTANTILANKRVTRVEVDPLTADLHVYFDGEIRIDVLNHSSRYEEWHAFYPSDSGETEIIGLGSGELAILHLPSAVRKS